MKQNKKIYKFVVAVLRPIVWLFFPYEIKGLENVSKLSGGYILCSNHLSSMDPVFLVLSHPAPIFFMAKAELFKNKILDWFFSSLGAFPVKRGKGDQQALIGAQEVIKNNDILGIFIEGTRSKTGEFLRPKSGTVLIAHSTQAPIVPVCITGGGKNNKVKVFKKTIINYGKAVMPSKLKIENGIRSEIKFSTNLIMDKIKELRT